MLFEVKLKMHFLVWTIENKDENKSIISSFFVVKENFETVNNERKIQADLYLVLFVYSWFEIYCERNEKVRKPCFGIRL